MAELTPASLDERLVSATPGDEDLVHFSCCKCGGAFVAEALVQKSKNTFLCKLCHRLNSLLTRHLGCRYVGQLEGSSEKAKLEFWSKVGAKCKDNPGLRYEKVKDVVVSQVVHRTVTEHAETLSGEFLPLSVYLAKGYSEAEVKNIASNCAWYHCTQLQVPVYCLRVLKSYHKEARVKAKEEWLQAERAVKKRQGPAGLTAPVEGAKPVAERRWAAFGVA